MTAHATWYGTPSSPGAIGWLLFAVCLVGATALGPRPAQAQSDQIMNLVEEAAGHYDQLQLAKARKKLERALQIADRQDVSGTPVARVHVMLAVVGYGANKDKDAALAQLKAALEQDPEVSVPEVYRTPTLEKLMKKAKANVDTSGSSSASSDGGSRRDVDEFTHEPIGSARAGEPLVVEAFVPTDMAIGRVNVYYKRYDQDSWTNVRLEATNATRFAVELAGYKVYTSQLAYYLEVLGPSGDRVASSGDRNNPHTITVLGSASFDPEEAKQKAKQRRSNNRESGDRGDDSEGDDSGSDSPSESRSREGSSTSAERTGYIEIGGGTGIGFAAGHERNDNEPPPTENPQRAINPGLAPAFAHLALGGGARLTETSTLGLYIRWQFAPGANFEKGRRAVGGDAYSGGANAPCLGTGLPGDCLLGVKYRRYFQGPPDLDFFASAGGGIGRVRQTVRLKELASTDYCRNNGKKTQTSPGGRPNYCYRPDTTRPGFFHVGAGGGFAYQFSETFSMLGEAYLQILFPDPAVNLDVTVGPQFRF